MTAAAEAGVRIFGVRHLSPGGARHLLDFLDEHKPTAVLIEGPSDATDEIRHLTEGQPGPGSYSGVHRSGSCPHGALAVRCLLS